MIKDILQFKGTWRIYQKRILDHFDVYNKDKKIHIVAAPGSGKTTLGIEIIRRINQNALILAPSLTIKQQWYDRIVDAFLKDGYKAEDCISKDLKDPKLITISTYQSIHSAIKKQNDEEDYREFSLIDMIRKHNIKTLCLDECHHLRSEWWKALEQLKKEYPDFYTVSLTATPPYDDDINMWNRYMKMCGDIDEEITIPELVKQNTLCPHQDYVYFNYPTKKETKQIVIFKEYAKEITEKLKYDKVFLKAVQSHYFFNNNINEEILLENPAYLSSMLIYLQSCGYATSYFKKLLGYQKLDDLNEKWMEILLQSFLYDDVDGFKVDEQYREELLKELKAKGLVEKRKVNLVTNPKIERMFTNSLGKLEGIKRITKHEYNLLKHDLRLLILTDYIRKEYENYLGDENFDVQHIGVLPIFEMLRKDNIKELKLGVLCGSKVIIPVQAKDALLELVRNQNITFSKPGKLKDYLEVNNISNSQEITKAITELFELGYIEVLIGTKSLLGEGWDSPCVNTLILASFVGSFMLSNQMRGRAIRVDKNNPDKTSHIWHLVCLRPKQDQEESESEDYKTLKRRMDHFLGLHYSEDTIENGINRLSIVKEPFNQRSIKKINEKMIEYSKERTSLKQRWDRSLAIYENIEIVEESEIKPQLISGVLFFDKLRIALIFILAFIFGLLIVAFTGMDHFIQRIIIGLYLGFTFAVFLLNINKIINLRNPLSRLKIFGNGVLKALQEINLIKSENCKVETQQNKVFRFICLKGGTGYEKTLFTKCVNEFFDPLDNQRYILYKPERKEKTDGYFVVPECFSKRKEDALLFSDAMKSFIGSYEVVYTKSAKGRKILLEGRKKSLANKQERILSRKKVKGALE